MMTKWCFSVLSSQSRMIMPRCNMIKIQPKIWNQFHEFAFEFVKAQTYYPNLQLLFGSSQPKHSTPKLHFEKFILQLNQGPSRLLLSPILYCTCIGGNHGLNIASQFHNIRKQLILPLHLGPSRLKHNILNSDYEYTIQIAHKHIIPNLHHK